MATLLSPATGPDAAAGAGTAPSPSERIRTSAGSGSIFEARPAIDPRFSAYVWPAVALGGTGAAIAAAMGAPVAAAALPLTADLPRILAQAAIAAAEHVGGPVPPTTNPPAMPETPGPLPYSPHHLPDGGDISLILLLLVCLVPLTLFGYTIVREVRSAPRWPIN